MFRALRVRNFRRYFVGQTISMCGTSAQVIALPWLVLELTGSGTRVGTVTAAQFVPVLVLGAWAGVVADRYDNRTLVLAVQSFLALQAAVLAVIVLTDVVELWMVYALAAMQGVGIAFDTPSRQSFVGEMVGDDNLSNALGLNGSLMQVSRIVGPLAAGVLIGTIGIGLCFAFNAVSFGAILALVATIDRRELRSRPRSSEAATTLDGVRYVATTPELRSLFVFYIVIATFAGNHAVLLPLLAEFVFDGGSGLYTALAAVSSVGALIAALGVSSRYRSTKGLIVAGAAALAVALALTAVAPNVAAAMVGVFLLGAASVTVGLGSNAGLQLGCRPEFRGRVIALYFLVAFGSNVIGAPIVGWIAEHYGVRWAVALGAVAAALVLVVGLGRWRARLGEPSAVAELAAVTA